MNPIAVTFDDNIRFLLNLLNYKQHLAELRKGKRPAPINHFCLKAILFRHSDQLINNFFL